MPGIVPYLMVNGASEASAFYQKAFGAEEKSRAPAQDGKRMMHLDLSINGGSVFLMDPFPEHGEMRFAIVRVVRRVIERHVE